MFRKISLVIFFLLFLLGITWLFLRHNIHTVIPNVLYRSAQLSSADLAYLVQKEGIKTVINLRGENLGADWYSDELAMTQNLHVNYYSIPMGAYVIAPPEQLQSLVHLLETAPKPILVHCQGGADRTGLASALGLLLFTPSSLPQAEEQFSWRYLVRHSNSTGKLTLPDYQAWLDAHGKEETSPDNVEAWVNQQH